ncbi:zinc finger protein 394 [Oncorhynchus tshawytscha]|uniref:C2H2-type domain-containing protein n=1 Tax=Oncorhynchus tshawytscha TaxID=74940 RepID=A0AAZ3SE08_ONCTS|nr:zinc finger protein 394 [Oncorhynchus tshawytscha]
MLPNIKSLRMLLNRRLKAAVDELFGAVETTIAEYQQELCRSKEEKDRTIAEFQEKMSRSEEVNARLQRLLDVVLKPEIKLQRLEDLQQLTLSISEEVSPEQQDCSPGLGQEEPSQSKVEQEELWVISQGQEQLQAMDYDTDDTDDSADTEACISTTRVKGDCNQNPSQSSHLYQVLTQCEENTDRDELPSTTMQIEQIKTENVSNSDSQPPFAVNSDWSDTQIESGDSVDWIESEGPPLKSKRTQTEVGPRFCTKVRESTKLSHLKSPIPGNAVRHCRICAKPFITMTSLVIHAHRQLSRCGICGRTFESVESLKEHLHFHVASTGSLSCYICGICFTEDEEVLLEEHMSNHKLYRCLVCKERFRYSPGSDSHQDS